MSESGGIVLDGHGSRDARSRSWVFTYNNYTEDQRSNIINFDGPSWILCAREIAPSTGTPHLQGCFVFKHPQRFSSLVNMFPGCWFSPMKGNSAQNVEYCFKADRECFERGERPQVKGIAGGVATKRKWDDAKTLAISGCVDDIEASIYIPYYKSLQSIAASHQQKPVNLEQPCAYWFYGKTGTGKSHAARDENPVHYLKGANKWFCGYQGEDCVIIEDIDPSHSWMGYSLKIWADKYPFNAEVKGSSMCIRPKKFVVTSNYHPSEIWTDKQILDPILRRFKVIHFRKLGDDEENRGDVEVRPAFNGSVSYVPGFVVPVLSEEDRIRGLNLIDDDMFNFLNS